MARRENPAGFFLFFQFRLQEYRQVRVDDFTFHKTFREDDVLHLRPVLDGLYQSYYKLVSAAMKATSDANQRFLTYVIDTITAVPADAGASVQVLVGDKEIDNGTAPTWAAGSNTVTVNVTAADGTAKKAYTVTVTKS